MTLLGHAGESCWCFKFEELVFFIRTLNDYSNTKNIFLGFKSLEAPHKTLKKDLEYEESFVVLTEQSSCFSLEAVFALWNTWKKGRERHLPLEIATGIFVSGNSGAHDYESLLLTICQQHYWWSDVDSVQTS